MDGSKVASAVRIGAALGAGEAVEWDEVLEAIGAAIPDMCAVQVCGWDPVAHGYVILAERGYPRYISQDLAFELPRTRWGEQLYAAGRPLLMDDHAPDAFRESAHYQERLHPAGLEDGLSMALRVEVDRRVGMLHLNAPVRSAFGEDEREFVAQIGPALARHADPLRCPAFDAWFDAGWAASRLAPGGESLPVTGRAPTALVEDPRIQALCIVFAGLNVESVAFVWPGREGWSRVMLLRVAERHEPHGGGVIVASAPFANAPGLTARELDVATGIVAGLSNQAIAEGLVVSRRTVETYVERLLGKLGCASRSEVAGIAARAGLVRPVPGPGGVGDIARLTRGADPYWR